MALRKPILVTGAHCSGTTWVGKMIAESHSVGYIEEPFNIHHSPGICGAKFHNWFQYVSDENDSLFYNHVRDTITFSYNLAEGIKGVRSPKDILKVLRDHMKFLIYRHSNVTALLKDPLAVFSAEWLTSRFDMNVVFLIRHPAAFASSLKIRNWKHPFSHFVQQPLLMRNHLYPFEAEIREYTKTEHDIIDQASLLWRLIYHVARIYQRDHYNGPIFLDR